jgi:hypothetical protein
MKSFGKMMKAREKSMKNVSFEAMMKIKENHEEN